MRFFGLFFNFVALTLKINYRADLQNQLWTATICNTLSIKYNLLNLPSEITFENGHKIFNIYAANGQKLESMYLTQRTLTFDPLEQTIGDVSNISEIHGSHYFGNIEYGYSDLHQRQDPKLLRIHNAEGYYSDNQYFYYRKDHLGNNRER
ncbi:MAG: hypothetical protein LBS50_11130 [Prevotellaceae bacterium]|nr:hypothetical protein [Prevotellaceae bacterium]